METDRKLGPEQSLPYDKSEFESADAYVSSLLHFVGGDDLLRTFCGGVHILDFFTSDPDLYSQVLPQEWRDFFAEHEIMDLLDLFMREDLELFSDPDAATSWRGGNTPPRSLIEYLRSIRRHLLDRKLAGSQCTINRTQKKLSRHVSVGMTVKKVHEVGLMASYIDNLAEKVSNTNGKPISHLVDFGSGQNYLGRALASQPYNRSVIAIESKAHNSERAKDYDVKARLVKKERLMRNKKLFRAGAEEPEPVAAPPGVPTASNGFGRKWEPDGQGRVTYFSHKILDGDLTDAIPKDGRGDDDNKDATAPGVMVMSLHSCGNLVHHGLRSLLLNPEVKAVAMVGCCYNLVTERLGPASFKLPELRPTAHLYPRMRLNGSKVNGNGSCVKGSDCGDPSGFPMSSRFCSAFDGEGVRLNITARMMAVQAPYNWGPKDSENFFTRHFYRALLQRVFLDHGVVGKPSTECVGGAPATGPNVSPAGHTSEVLVGGGPGGPPFGTPITIGSLRKGCYDDFVAYFHGAYAKLTSPPSDSGPASQDLAELIKRKLSGITDAELEAYEIQYLPRKNELSVIWSLMAFSAGVIEAAIVVDRWLWLREQEVVRECWVESVFDYAVSPRNLVVVGVKKEK
jgi:hypothetical protein